MKLIFLTAAICAIFVGTCFLLPPPEHIWTIGDASKPQEHKASDWLHSKMDGQMAIRVTGDLSAPANLETPLGMIELPAVEFDIITYSAEAWSSSASLRFKPTDGGKGDARVTVCLGSSPEWVHRPPPSALPKLYTGGWTAYFPKTDNKAWSGGFHHGIKMGRFTYWDEAGNVMYHEEWENGKKKS